jgi:flavin-binding protein dodecin
MSTDESIREAIRESIREAIGEAIGEEHIRSGIRGAIGESIKEAREVIKSLSVSSSKQQRADVQRAATSSILVSGQMSTLAVDRGALRDALIERLVVANTVLVLEART